MTTLAAQLKPCRSARQTLMLAAVVTVPVVVVFFCLMGRFVCGSRDTKLSADLAALGQSLRVYENLNGRYPTTEQGLNSLVNFPAAVPRPEHRVQLLKQIPRDPFRQEYVYACPGKHNPAGYDLYTKGKDGVAGTADDLGNWGQ